MKKVSIPAPKFAKHQSAWMDWNGERKVSITRRWYDFDDECWSYEIFGEDGKFYPECALNQLTPQFVEQLKNRGLL